MAGAVSWDFPRPARLARVMCHAGLERGLTMRAMLAGTGLRPADLDDTAVLIDGEQELTVARNLVTGLGDPPGLGVETIDGFPLTGLGVLGYALLASPTVGSMLTLAIQCKQLSFTFADTRVDVDDHDARVILDMGSVPDDVRGFLRDRDVSAAAALLSVLCGSHVPLRLELSGSPVQGAALAKLPYVRSTSFEHAVDAVVLHRHNLELPLRQADEETFKVCRRACVELVERRKELRSVARRVTACIASDPSRLVTMGAVAGELHVAPRTLRRHLLAEGVTFRGLIADVREALAIDLLTAGVSVEQTALRLGYSEAASFTRAFRHRTGYPPSRYPVAEPAAASWPKLSGSRPG